MSNSLGCYIGAPADPALLPFAICQNPAASGGEGGGLLFQTSSLLPPPTGLNLWIRHCIGSILVTHTCMHIRYKNTSIGKHSIKLISLFHWYLYRYRFYLLTIQYTSTQLNSEASILLYTKGLKQFSNFSQFAEEYMWVHQLTFTESNPYIRRMPKNCRLYLDFLF